jgi:hypothetical protein
MWWRGLISRPFHALESRDALGIVQVWWLVDGRWFCLGRLVRAVGQGPRRRRTNRCGRGASKSRQGKYTKERSVAVFE